MGLTWDQRRDLRFWRGRKTSSTAMVRGCMKSARFARDLARQFNNAEWLASSRDWVKRARDANRAWLEAHREMIRIRARGW